MIEKIKSKVPLSSHGPAGRSRLEARVGGRTRMQARIFYLAVASATLLALYLAPLAEAGLRWR